MERKDYAERFLAIKNEILKEIREIVGFDERYEFKDKPYVHYVEGEVATTEICTAVEVWFEGDIVICVTNTSIGQEISRDNEGLIEMESVFNFTAESLLEILNNLKKEVREEKLSKLREIVKKAGGEIVLDGKFKFTGIDNGQICENNYLTDISIQPNGKLMLDTTFEGGDYCNYDSYPIDEELDRIIEYVESQTMKKYSIKVSGSFSRTFEIEAKDAFEALSAAKREWKANPLCHEDSNGEDWKCDEC